MADFDFSESNNQDDDDDFFDSIDGSQQPAKRKGGKGGRKKGSETKNYQHFPLSHAKNLVNSFNYATLNRAGEPKGYATKMRLSSDAARYFINSVSKSQNFDNGQLIVNGAVYAAQASNIKTVRKGHLEAIQWVVDNHDSETPKKLKRTKKFGPQTESEFKAAPKKRGALARPPTKKKGPGRPKKNPLASTTKSTPAKSSVSKPKLKRTNSLGSISKKNTAFDLRGQLLHYIDFLQQVDTTSQESALVDLIANKEGNETFYTNFEEFVNEYKSKARLTAVETRDLEAIKPVLSYARSLTRWANGDIQNKPTLKSGKKKATKKVGRPGQQKKKKTNRNN